MRPTPTGQPCPPACPAGARLIGRLEKGALVERVMCDLDRRGIYVSLSPLGRERYEAAGPLHRAVLARTLTSRQKAGC